MASGKLLNYLRQAELEKRNDDKNSYKNTPFYDESKILMQRQQNTGPGKYMLSDIVSNAAKPKVNVVFPSVMETYRVPSAFQPGISPTIVPTETQLRLNPIEPKGSIRDGINFNEVTVPYQSVVWDRPLNDMNELWYPKKDNLRPTGASQRLVQDDYFETRLALPVIYGMKEPMAGPRLPAARDSRLS